MIIIIITFITVIFLLTLPQSIGLGDSGLLAAAAASLGIPNPPGFPSYVLLGHLFTKLPWGSIAWRLGLISVLSSVGTILLVKRLAGLPAALFLAFSYSFWSQAVNVETYALTNFVIMLVSFLVWQEKPKLWLIGIFLGLGAGLNPIVISILPSLAFLSLKGSHPSRLVMSACVAVMIATATYSYLPIRAAAHPFLNWSDPSTFDRFFKHVTGGGLSVVSSTAINGFTGSFTWYVDAWMRFGYLIFVNYLGIGLAIAGLGAYAMYKKDRTKFWFWILLVFTNVSLAGLYTSGNRDSWFVTSFIAGAVFLGEGMNKLGRLGRLGIYAIVLLPLFIWFPVMRTRATSTFTIDYINDLYRDLPENALLLGGGETFNALTVYAHEALKLRPDVTPIDMTIFYGQRWYRENMGYKGDKGDRVEMPKFMDEMEFTRILEQFVAANSDSAGLPAGRQVFVTGYLLRQPVYGGTLTPAYVPERYQLIQKGIVYQLIKSEIRNSKSETNSNDQNSNDPNISNFDIRISNLSFPWYLESNYQKAIDLIRMEYAFRLETEGIQLLQDGDQTQAFDRFTRAGEVAPLYFDQNRLGEIMRSIQTATPTAVPKER